MATGKIPPSLEQKNSWEKEHPWGQKNNSEGRRVHFYGRTKGRPLSARKRRLLKSQIEKWGIARPVAPFDPRHLFNPPVSSVWLEIGFGNGDHMLEQAVANPDTGILGCEIFTNSLAQCCARIAETGISNIRLYRGDARHIISALAPMSVDRVFILFPDPWPKRRHHKRRLVTRTTLSHLASALKPGGDVRLATDDATYAEWMMGEALTVASLTWMARKRADWLNRPADWPPTRYEKKAENAGKPCYFLHLCRHGDDGDAASCCTGSHMASKGSNQVGDGDGDSRCTGSIGQPE